MTQAVLASVALAAAVANLREASVPNAATDARILLAHALKIDRSRLTLVLQEPLPFDNAQTFDKLISARIAHQPIAQIIGSREFYGRQFKVTPEVLDPRPDTELLIDLALKQPFDTVLDLGTGTGCILLTLLAETAAMGMATDISTDALNVAKDNAKTLGLESRAAFIESDWFDSIPPQKFDLIVSNPPYISEESMKMLAPDVREWEPHGALTPGGDGLGPYEILTANAARFLAPKGRLLVEIGFDQGAAVFQMFQDANFTQVAVSKDTSGHDRVVSGISAQN